APAQYKKALDTFVKTQAALGVAYDPASYYGGMKSLSSLVLVKNYISDETIPLDTDTYTKIYGSMDKAAAHGDGYALGFSMFSSRMGGVESINNENLKGWNTSDGTLTLYNGDQGQFGEGFWATVDPTRLAGITTNHETKPMSSNNIKTNDRDWVGGSAFYMDNYASIGMDFKSTISDLEAKKSWFVFDDQIVALGAGITTTAGDYTETIVENRKIGNNNKLLVNGSEAVAANGTEQKAANWAWLSENAKGSAIGYYFPEETQVSLKRETRTGRWTDVNKNLKPGDADEVTKDYISIAMDHGTAPTDAAYGYVLLPGKTSEEMAAYAADNGIQILSNTEQLQAAADAKSGVSGYNFWSAGESAVPKENGITKMTSDSPVSVTMFNDGSKNIHLAISDPTQKSSTVTLRLEGTGLSVAGADEGVVMNKDASGITLTVNVANKFGATINAIITSENATLGETVKYVTVTLHYPDAADGMTGKRLLRPDSVFSDPRIEGSEAGRGDYGYKWYTDKEKTTLYDFSTVVTGNLDLYGERYYYNEVKVTLHYPNKTIQREYSKTIENEEGKKEARKLTPEELTDPEETSTNYEASWYTDENRTILYDFEKELVSDLHLYALYKDQIGGTDEEGVSTGIKALRIPAQQYTGKPIKPQVTVFDGEKVLKEKEDYKLSYTKNKNVGTAVITVIPCGNYEKSDKFPLNFEIVPRQLTERNVTVNYTPVMNVKLKNGKPVAQKPKKVTLKYGTMTIPAKDYTVTYTLNGKQVNELTDEGIYKMNIKTTSGSFSADLNYDVVLTNKTLMSALKISVAAAEWSDGKPVEPPVTVKYKGRDVSVADNFDIAYANNVNAGTASVTLTAKRDNEDYYGSRTVSFKIKGIEIKKARIDNFVSSVDYAGKPLEQQDVKLVLKTDGQELVKDKDYRISYSNNLNVGKATMTITGLGQFSGTVKKNFSIKKVNLQKQKYDVQFTTVKPGEEMQVLQDKSGAKPKVKVKLNDKLLVQNVDYTVSYSGNKAVGANGKVTIKGIGNYTGNLKNVLSFKIREKDLTHSHIVVEAADLKYAANGKYKAKVTVYDNGAKLASNEYTVSPVGDVVVNDNQCGTLKVKLEGKKNYTGTRDVTVNIKKALISSAKINVKGDYYYNNGVPVELEADALEVTIGSGNNKETLRQGVDFRIVPGSYSNHTKAGNATVTITGIGEYGGTKVVKYRILPKWMTIFKKQR
ncbi:MAG: hypothetical protein HFH79_16540, partial [Lachnospiraceae bacterium]|nr:hypothetical protein [Lachnospiraceae bacterium]